MGNNEKVSGLVELLGSGLQSGDLFLITDISQKESKKLELGQLLLFIESSGSFNALNAAIAATASYVSVGNVSGIIPFSTNSSQSISSSYSLQSSTSAFAGTASWAINTSTISTQTQTSSFLLYNNASSNGTSSYSSHSLFSDTSNLTTTALNLFYNGQPNGTCSYSLISSATISSSFSSQSFTSVSSSWASSSISSSYSNSSSYVVGGTGPTFIVPITVAATNQSVTNVNFNCSPYVPIGTTRILLDAATTNTLSSHGLLTIRSSSLSPYYVLLGNGGTGGQGTFPISSVGSLMSFVYSFDGFNSVQLTLRLIGYY